MIWLKLHHTRSHVNAHALQFEFIFSSDKNAIDYVGAIKRQQ